MMNKPCSSTSISECGNCGAGADHRWFLHHVRLRGIYRRLCTSCVLKLHPGSFCPNCFELFDTTPPYHRRVICQKCPSISHPNCVPNSDNNGNNISKPYICPPCSNPSFSFFDLKKNSEEGDKQGKVIEKKAATVLLCAAKITAMSMSKAVLVARAEADRRVREAALSRKRAREALEHLVAVAAKEKAAAKFKDGLVEGSGSIHVGLKEKNGGNVVGNLLEHNRIESKVKVDTYGDVLANFDKEEKKVQEIRVKNEALVISNNGMNNVGLEDEERKKVSNEVGGEVSIENHGAVVSEVEKLDNVANLNNHDVELEKMNNGLLPVHPVEDQLLLTETSYGRREEASS